MNAGRVVKTINDCRYLGLTLDFRGPSRKGGDKETGLPFSDGWIRKRLPRARFGTNRKARDPARDGPHRRAAPAKLTRLSQPRIDRVPVFGQRSCDAGRSAAFRPMRRGRSGR